MYNVTIDPAQLSQLIATSVKDAIAAIKPTSTSREYLTVAEAAKYVKCSKSTVENWIDEGAIKARQYGRVKRVLRDDLDGLLS